MGSLVNIKVQVRQVELLPLHDGQDRLWTQSVGYRKQLVSFFSCGDGVEERQTTGDLGEVGQVGVGNVVDLREEVVPEFEEQRAGDIERILVRI